MLGRAAIVHSKLILTLIHAPVCGDVGVPYMTHDDACEQSGTEVAPNASENPVCLGGLVRPPGLYAINPYCRSMLCSHYTVGVS